MSNIVNNINRYWKVFLRLLKASLMAEMEYKVNFITSFFLINIWLAMNVIFYKSTFSMINYIGNWNEDQALFFVAAFNVVDNLFFLLFFKSLLDLPNAINLGQYDYILLKPISKVFMTCFKTFDVSRVINTFFSLILFIYTINFVSIKPVPFVFFLVMMINGILIYASIFLIISSLSFHFISIYNVINIFFDVMEFGRLPSTITKGALRFGFMFVFPILFIAGIPCEYLFSQNNFKLVLLSTSVTILFVVIAVSFFKFSVSRYSSASS